MNENALQDLFDEIGASFATLDADTPREAILPCPRCNQDRRVTKNQRSGLWELSCSHTEEHRTRATMVQQWNVWAKPFADTVRLCNTDFMSREFDFIADIHGQYDKLASLLGHLGYEANDAHGFRHPEGRRVVFLGDYIDRGPKIRETLQTVRAMVDAGDALAIMGNHEFNAIAWATLSPKGHGTKYLRHHGSKNRAQHAATLNQFEGLEEEWKDWLHWFKQLPMWLNLGQARAVHACWDQESLAVLTGGSLTDDTFLEACAIKGTKEYTAVETLLKGPEMDLPDGSTFTDKQGIERSRIRSRWWNLNEAVPRSFGELAMPPGSLQCEVAVELAWLKDLPNYTNDGIPVFFGHYWLPPSSAMEPLAKNIGCLDFSAGLNGPLVAYRWDGESQLRAEKMVCAP